MASQRYITPSVEIELDKIRMLRVNFNALIELEERTGRSVMNAEAWSGMKTADVRLMLWLSLREDDPTLTEKQVGRLLHLGNLPYVMGQVSKAWTNAISGPEDGSVRPLAVPAGMSNETFLALAG